MENLLKETLFVLKENGKSMEDVRYIGSNDVQISKEDFITLANREYDHSYGSSKVPTDLMLIGDNWWLERGEYDGSEWWNFKAYPGNKVAPEIQKVYSLTSGMWNSLSEFLGEVSE